MERTTRSLLRLRKRVFQKDEPARTVGPNLPNLPYELLHIISRELSEYDICSLSLVCKHLFAVFNPLEPFKPTKNRSTRQVFLSLLEKDLPDHLQCFSCNKIYRWRVPGQEHPVLCPNREKTRHFTYAHLDFQHHDRRIEREIIDLAYLRFKHGPEYGLPLSYVLKRLRGEEKLDKSLRMPAVSLMSAAWTNKKRLLIETEIEVKVKKNDNSHPFAPFIEFCEPERWTDQMLPTSSLIHGRLSAVTRRVGLNVHENRWAWESLGDDGCYASFYSCRSCQVSVQVSVRHHKQKWCTVALKTAQNMGARGSPYDRETIMAGIRTRHKELMPKKKCKVLSCVTTHSRTLDKESQHPPFCDDSLSVSKENEDPTNIPLEDSLSITAWFQRHMRSHEDQILHKGTIQISGQTRGYSRRKYLLPWILWELPTAILWGVPKILLWDIPKIFVWEWPTEKFEEYQKKKKAAEQVKAPEVSS